MARGLFRKTSFNKMVGAYRSQWKRFWMRLFTFGAYGSKGMGWWRDPKKACYNWWYYRTSISIPRLLGYKPSKASFFCAMLAAAVISIFAAPVDATQAGIKAHKIRARRKARVKSSRAKSSTSTGTNSKVTRSAVANQSGRSNSTVSVAPKSTTSTKAAAKTAPHRNASHTTINTIKNTTAGYTASQFQTPDIQSAKSSQAEKLQQNETPSTILFSHESEKPVSVPTEPVNAEPDENTPKSKPKNVGDQYIKKRMIIAGSSYCEKSVLEKLTVGTYFDLEAEPTNPYDKDAVMLVHNGEKIGYVSKQDNAVFVTCLRLKRKVYGVITDIITEPYPTKYEYETWFDSSR